MGGLIEMLSPRVCGTPLHVTDASVSLLLDTVEITNCDHLPRPCCTAAFANYMWVSSDRIGAPKAAPPGAI
jgi:hypothetical protein